MIRNIDNVHQYKLVLTDNSQREVAVALSNEYLACLEQLPEYKNIVEPLRSAREVMWPKVLANKEKFFERTKERQQEYQRILNGIATDDDRMHFIESIGKLGHLYEVAGQIARDNYFAKEIINQGSVPHGADEYIGKAFKTPEAAVEQLNKAKFEPTFTSHPTNNNSYEMMQAIRALGEAASDVRRDGKEEQTWSSFAQAMDDFVKAPLVPKTNFSVLGETRQMLVSAENVYHDLGASYRHFDRALEDKAEESKHVYDPLTLQLGVKLNFWGSSGDKDGNKKVNADTTLEAAYMHTAKMAELLSRDLQKILGPKDLFESPYPELEALGKQLKTQATELNQIRQDIAQNYRHPRKPLPPEEFDRLSAKLSTLAPDTKRLEEVATKAYKSIGPKTSPENVGNQKEELLMLIRRARTFGPHMGKIEYRETSEEFGRIVSLIDPQYKALVEENAGLIKKKKGASGEEAKPIDARMEAIETEKVARLTYILQSGKAPEMLARVRGEIQEKGFGHSFDKDPYPADNPYAIAYHTLKRLELARDNPDLLANHVLAECQGLSNKLELKLLMDSVEKNGKKPVLGIIPLYEDPDVMQKVGDIERTSYRNPAYRKHLEEFAAAHPDECSHSDKGDIKLTQQVQFAHSDNRRRGGPAAAVGFIDKAHRDFRAAAEDAGIEPRNYEGGSLSDAFRNGVRSVSAMISEFGLYKFTKLTFQGGDLLNYFGHPHSCERLITRSITHCAKHYDDPVPAKDIASDPYNFLAVKALQGTLRDYEENIFQTDRIGLVIAHSGFGKQEMNAGNVGTRAQRDPTKVFVTIDHVPLVPEIPEKPKKVPMSKTRVSMGAVYGPSKPNAMIGADPDAIRTISFSELLEHAGVYPTWLGTRTIPAQVAGVAQETLDRMDSKPSAKPDLEEREFRKLLEKVAKDQGKDPSKPAKVPARLMQILYNKSPAYREVIDRMAFGISMSSLDSLEELNPILKNTRFMDDLKKEYIAAGDITLSSMDGGHRSLQKAMAISGATETAAMRQAVTTALAHMKPSITHKRNYMEFINYFKRDYKDKHPGEEAPMPLLYATHCAMDTASHGRWLTADDPRYGEAISGVELNRGAATSAVR